MAFEAKTQRMTDDKRPEGPAKIVQAEIDSNYWTIEINGYKTVSFHESSGGKRRAEKEAEEINRALAPLIAKAVAAEKMAAFILVSPHLERCSIRRTRPTLDCLTPGICDCGFEETLAVWEKTKT